MIQLPSKFRRLFSGSLLFLTSHFTQAGPVTPLPGFVSPLAKPLRKEICLNGLWQFQPIGVPSDWATGTGQPPELPLPDPTKWEAVLIRIPSPWNSNGAFQDSGAERSGDFHFFPSYPKSWNAAIMVWLRRNFTVPADWNGSRIILQFEAIAGDCQILENGKKLHEQFDSFLPFSVDVTETLRSREANEILVGVRAPELHNTKSKVGMFPYPTGSFWNLFVAGIWQDVFLLGLPTGKPVPFTRPDGTILEALQVGPFPATDYAAALNTDFLEGETTHVAKPGTAAKKSFAWQEVQTDARGFSVFPSAANETSYLAFTVLCKLSQDLLQNPYGTDITLKITADDGARLWQNGQLIFEVPGPQSSDEWNEKSVTVPLKNGDAFLLKVPNTSGVTEARMKIRPSRAEVAEAISL